MLFNKNVGNNMIIKKIYAEIDSSHFFYDGYYGARRKGMCN